MLSKGLAKTTDTGSLALTNAPALISVPPIELPKQRMKKRRAESRLKMAVGTTGLSLSLETQFHEYARYTPVQRG
jgi:hypothetical protein